MYERDGLGMFHGRLVLLGVLMLLGTAVLAAQIARLTVLEGPALREQAERRLVRLTWEATTRGRILDRKGRVLAQDRPTFEAQIAYDVLAGRWAGTRSVVFARRAHGDTWPQLEAGQRDALARAYEPIFAAHAERSLAVLADAAGEPLEEILRRRRAALARVASVREQFVNRRLQELRDASTARGRELTAALDQRLREQAQRPVREQRQPHTVIPEVSDDVGFALMDLRDRRATLDVPLIDPEGSPTGVLARVDVPAVPGLTIANARAREYPFDHVTVAVDKSTLPGPLADEAAVSVDVPGPATAIVGWVRDSVWAEDPARRAAWLRERASPERRARALTDRGTDRGQYMAGDRVGHRGVEATLEHTLRGLRGLSVRQLDTGDTSRLPRTPGSDVRLSLDVMLQARIAAAMSPRVGLAVSQPWHGDAQYRRDTGQPLEGAAVVLDIDTGEVLALVSTPTVSVRDARAYEPDSAHDATDPMLHRAAQAMYPPGSIAKAMTLAWAGSRGEHALGERIACTGHYLPGRTDILRCWIWRPRFGMLTHSDRLGHDPDEAEALMVSCNIYFYTLGERLGVRRMFDCYRAFGVGSEPLKTLPASPGQLGLGGGSENVPLTSTDAALLGIGQGPIAWTPLHAAAAYATLARGGLRLGPTLLAGRQRRGEDIGLDPTAVERALRGLWLSVNDRDGTGYHVAIDGRYYEYFNAPGVSVWGKTGTAQVPATLTKLVDGVPTPVFERYTHAWFVGLVGPAGGRPRYAVAVMMEYAGSGGRVSAPIANQIIHALRAEGYLGTGEAGGGHAG